MPCLALLGKNMCETCRARQHAWDDVGRSLAKDRQTKAKTKTSPSRGDNIDR